MLTNALKRIAKDRVLLTLTLALVAATVLLLAWRRDAYSSSTTGTGTGTMSQRWGCPTGHVEYEKGCYNPATKTYTQGKKLVL